MFSYFLWSLSTIEFVLNYRNALGSMVIGYMPELNALPIIPAHSIF